MSENIKNWHEVAGVERDFFSDNPFAEEIWMFKLAKEWIIKHRRLIIGAGLIGIACIV